MPIDKVSAAQFAQAITAGIASRDATLDTTIGPIPDSSIQPQAAVLEQQNDRTRQLSLMLSLANGAAFNGFEADLEGIAFNEGMTRNPGAASSLIEVFSRTAAPTADLLVQRGYPLGSQPDASTGATVVYVASEKATLPAATANSFFNLVTQRYELSVPYISVVQGINTQVGPNRVNRFLQPPNGFDSATNPAAAVGGRDQETNQQLINRYLLGVVGRQLGTPNGIKRAVLSQFAGVSGLFVVFGTNPLLTRAATDAGAVDVWIKGSANLQTIENHPFLGVGQLIVVGLPPLVDIVSVSSGATVYVAGTDYVQTNDTSGVSRSTRETAGVTFLPGGPNPLPAVGDVVTVTYTFDNLIRALQAEFETDGETEELGRDLLFRRGIEVPIIHQAQLRVTTGSNATTVLAAVRAAVLTFINGLGMGDAVEGSDIQAVVRAISGVDNYVITRLTRSTVLVGTSDIAIGGNEFATLSSANLLVTLV